MLNYRRKDDTQFYFIGGGIGSLTGAAYLLRDCGFEGKNIHIIESLPIAGGSNDAKGDPEKGYVMRGERMFTKMTYENFFDIYASIPSFSDENISVADEMLHFSEVEHKVFAKARFLDGDGEIMDASSLGLDKKDLLLMFNLLRSEEAELNDLAIEDWFGDSDNFFTSIFWYSFVATYAFTPKMSLIEFRRYVLRFFYVVMRITTANGVVLTPRNQYESLILPIMKVLNDAGVNFIYDTTVTDMDFLDDAITVTGLHTESKGEAAYIKIRPQDKVVATLGTLTDNSSEGSSDQPANFIKDVYPMSARLWKKIATKKEGFGNPDVFFSDPDASAWMTFNCTFKGNTMMDWLEKYTHNKTGEGLSSTFVESPWFMELRNPTPPFFENQTEDYSFLWMVAFASHNEGKYIKKSQFDCTGREILEEILQSLPMDEATRQQIRSEVVAAIPVILPFADAHFLPRSVEDRPKVIPEGSTNLAVIGQYVEIPEDITYTEEYSVRGARTAVYQLLDMKREVAPVKPIRYDIRVILGTLIALLK